MDSSCLSIPGGPLLGVSPGTPFSQISRTPDLPVSQHPGMVSCGLTEARRLPLSDFANTHAWGLPPSGPRASTPAVSAGLLLGFFPIDSSFLANTSASWLSHHHLSGRPARIPESCAESSIASLWVQLLASVQEWCEREDSGYLGSSTLSS